MKFFSILVALLLPLCAMAQQPQNSEEMEKALRESIEKEIDRQSSLLDLADWQVFYLDSILFNNYSARNAELMKLQAAKVSQSEIYYQISDKWAEETYNAIHKIYNEEQWEKYLKIGAARDKKARDKRAAKKQ